MNFIETLVLCKDEEHEWKRLLAYVSRMYHRSYRSDSFPIPFYEEENNKQTLHLPTILFTKTSDKLLFKYIQYTRC